MRYLRFIVPSLSVGVIIVVRNSFNPSSRINKAQIARDGGHALSLPDNRLLEYFEFGACKEEAESTLLAIHGGTTTGQLWRIHDQWGKKNKVRIISPSLPGWGLSEAMPLTATPQDWASRDATFLLQTLGFNNENKVHLMGASLGSIYASALVCTPEAKHMIGDVMLYVAFAPKSKTHDPLEGSKLKIFSQMYTFPILARLLEKFIFIPLIKALLPGDVRRSVRNQWEGLWKCRDDIYGEWNLDWPKMSVGRKVIIVSGSRDGLVRPRNQIVLHESIHGSLLVSYDGGHEAPVMHPELMQGHFGLLLKK